MNTDWTEIFDTVGVMAESSDENSDTEFYGESTSKPNLARKINVKFISFHFMNEMNHFLLTICSLKNHWFFDLWNCEKCKFENFFELKSETPKVRKSETLKIPNFDIFCSLKFAENLFFEFICERRGGVE